MWAWEELLRDQARNPRGRGRARVGTGAQGCALRPRSVLPAGVWREGLGRNGGGMGWSPIPVPQAPSSRGRLRERQHHPRPSPLLGLQLLAPALMEKVLESVSTMGQNRLLLGLGFLLSQLCLDLAPCLKFPERFLGNREHRSYSIRTRVCTRAHRSFLLTVFHHCQAPRPPPAALASSGLRVARAHCLACSPPLPRCFLATRASLPGMLLASEPLHALFPNSPFCFPGLTAYPQAPGDVTSSRQASTPAHGHRELLSLEPCHCSSHRTRPQRMGPW